MSGYNNAWDDLNFVISMLVSIVVILILAISIMVFLKAIIFPGGLIFAVILFLPKTIFELRRHIRAYLNERIKAKLMHNTVIIGGVRGDKHRHKRIQEPRTQKVLGQYQRQILSSKGDIMRELGIPYEKPIKKVNAEAIKPDIKDEKSYAIWTEHQRIHPKALELIRMTEEKGRVIIKEGGGVSGHHGNTLGALIESAIKRLDTNVELARKGNDLILTLNRGVK